MILVVSLILNTFDALNNRKYVAENVGSSTGRLTINTDPPIMTLTSPTNITYANSDILLNFTVNESTSWIGYSLDGNTNITIMGDILLTSLSEGSHSVILFANDTEGNMGSSSIIWFTIDTIAPIITVVSPDGGHTNQEYVWLNITVNEPISWMGYYDDMFSMANITFSGQTLIGPFSEGFILIDVYANDTAGNMAHAYAAMKMDFTPPILNVTSPKNETYTTSKVWVNFSINEVSIWNAYSLDNKPNVSISYLNPPIYNILLDLEEGVHSLVVYTKDAAGNEVASSIIWFTVDVLSININHPVNASYSQQDLWLNFTTDDLTSWAGYSLDGNPNITITGDVVLTSLSEGSHSVILFANDTEGNMGSSSIIWFTIDLTSPIVSILTPSQSYYSDSAILVQYGFTETGSIQFYLNDTSYPFIANGSTITLSDGEYNLTLTVTDPAGNIGLATVIFTVESPTTTITTITSSKPVITTPTSKTTTEETTREVSEGFVFSIPLTILVIMVLVKRKTKK